MIGNSSRLTQFQGCREKAYNWDELRLVSWRDADPLMIGDAYHFGAEVLTKTGDPVKAADAAEARFRDRLKGQMILDEEKPEIEREVSFVRHATMAFAQNYHEADFRMLWPEVVGLVPLPNTTHHCFFVHRILHPEVPFDKCPFSDCTLPHYFKFKTDGIIEFFHKIWLWEQKTTSSTNRNNFWPKFNMDFQIGSYMYGAWKVTGKLPSGVLVNAVIKTMRQDKNRPTGKGGYHQSLVPHEVGFEREAFTYSPEMVLSFERDLILLMNDYERAFSDPNNGIYRNTHNCFSYNRQCYYWERCQRKHGGANTIDITGEFRERENDYVNKAYYELLGINPPEEKKELEPIHGTT